VIVTVPDAEALHAQFAAGLRERFGRVPAAGIPRMLRPRRKQGTAAGFTVVDVGGNWLRIYRAADVADGAEPEPSSSGLARAVEVVARQGDARGDEAQALRVLDAGLTRHPDALPADRVRALAYRAELLVRLGRVVAARGTLAEAACIADGAAAADLAHAARLVDEAEG
jgi:hypothetical protein